SHCSCPTYGKLASLPGPQSVFLPTDSEDLSVPLRLYPESLSLHLRLLPQFREPRHPAASPQLWVTGTADPGTQAPAHQRFESGELPEEDSETDLSPRLPAAHLIGAWTTGQGLGWEAKKEEAFLSSGTQFSGAEGLALPQDGLYYLYCHIGYRGRAPPPAVEPLDGSVTLLSRLYRAGGAYGSGTPELLLEGAETVTPVSDPARRHDYGPLWYTSVGFGGLVQLRRGERVYVNISHPDMVDYRRGKTFFGAVMVG
uniref:Lymphotoxin-beta n=1 Tax=Bos taurus TaxID=9913 RepID=A0AAA9TVB7_BOVIN